MTIQFCGDEGKEPNVLYFNPFFLPGRESCRDCYEQTKLDFIPPDPYMNLVSKQDWNLWKKNK